MRGDTNNPAAHLSSVFWDGFDALRAMGELTRSGFSPGEICALGILAGSLPNLEEAMTELGVPESETELLTRLFDEGAVVVVVYAPDPRRRQAATRLMKQCGGIFAHAEQN